MAVPSEEYHGLEGASLRALPEGGEKQVTIKEGGGF